MFEKEKKKSSKSS